MDFEKQLRELTQDDNYSIEFSKNGEDIWVMYVGHQIPVIRFSGVKELEHFLFLLKELKDKVNLTTGTVGDTASWMSMAISHECYHRRDNATDEVIEVRSKEELEKKLKECSVYKKECEGKSCASYRNNKYIHLLQYILSDYNRAKEEIEEVWNYYNNLIGPFYTYEDRKAAEANYKANKNKKGAFRKYKVMLLPTYDEYTWCNYTFYAWVTKNAKDLF